MPVPGVLFRQRAIESLVAGFPDRLVHSMYSSTFATVPVSVEPVRCLTRLTGERHLTATGLSRSCMPGKACWYRSCLFGFWLLDTADHILDYSKISNLIHNQKRERARVDAARHKLADWRGPRSNPTDMTDVDIVRLTEEVTQSVVSAFRYSQSLGDCKLAGPNSSAGSIVQSEKGDVSVTLGIDKRAGWTTPMAPGSWTRVLTNIGKRVARAATHYGWLRSQWPKSIDKLTQATSWQCAEVYFQ